MSANLHVHDLPAHQGTLHLILCSHTVDQRLTEIHIHNTRVAVVIQVCTEGRISTPQHQDLIMGGDVTQTETTQVWVAPIPLECFVPSLRKK